MQNRQKDEIIRDILTVCNGGNIISHIMFHTYITHTQAKVYLGELIEKGLVENYLPEKRYQTTAKGLQYLHALENVTEMLALETRKARINTY